MKTIFRDESLRISRDEHGVPHIRAASEPDLYRGLGYCHAFDRGLQMLLQRILGYGRGSEILDSSDEMLRIDTFFRRMNLGGNAVDEVAKIPAADGALAQAYCDGAGAALQRRVPWELRLLRYKPEPWTPADLVLMSRMAGYVALAQSQGDMERLLLEMVQAGVPRPHLDELFPGSLRDLDVDLLQRVVLGERIVPEGVRWNRALPRMMASNNWAVSGRRTASGKPLLSNDPHLEVNRLPAIWYEVVLEVGERFCIAATMPGMPGALLGRNNDLAWGATYTFMDAIDSWIEDCRNGSYRRSANRGEAWVPFRRRTEVVKRRRKKDVTLTFYENDHGVLEGNPTTEGLYLATRWASGLETGARSLSAIFGMLNATSVAEGMELLGRLETAWNWVLADSRGNIGYQMSGLMPLRRVGRDGLVPLPGWEPENDWRGFAHPHDLPRCYNPRSGFVVTANDDLNHLGRARPINLPMGDHRARRIAELLDGRSDWNVEHTREMLMDVYSPQAAKFMEILRPLLPESEAGKVLREWDYRYDLDSQGAPLFEAFYRRLIQDVFGAVCGADVLALLTEETGIVTDFYANFDRVLLRETSAWYGDEGRAAVWTRVAAGALGGPLRTWGERQRVLMKHLMLGGRFPRWLKLDRGPIPLIGGRATIHQGQVYRAGGRDTSFAPSYRLVVDLAENTAHTRLCGGPSDRPFSRLYASEVDGWLAGSLKVVRPGAEERQKAKGKGEKSKVADPAPSPSPSS